MFHNLTVSITNDNVGEGDEIITLELVTSLEVNTISVGSNQDTTVITIIEDDSKQSARDIYCTTFSLWQLCYISMHGPL